MKKKGLAIVLIVTLATVFSTMSVSFGATRIGKPTIHVDVYQDDYIKISWNECKGATKYQIYRSTSKTKNYKKIATVSDSMYWDYTAKNKTRYYYKVRGVKGSVHGRFSKPKSQKINFSGSLSVSKSKITLQKGSQAVLFVKTKGTNDSIIATGDSSVLDYEWGLDTEDGYYPLYISAKKMRTKAAYITLYFEEHPHPIRVKIKVNFDNTSKEEISLSKIRAYPNLSAVPDFGAMVGVRPARVSGYNYFMRDCLYVYPESSIDIDAEEVIQMYISCLEEKGFSPIDYSLDEDFYEYSYASENGEVVTFEYDGDSYLVRTMRIIG